MNTETKQPAAGEYWEWAENEQRVLILLVDEGDIICRAEDGGIRYWIKENSGGFLKNFRHLPDCDSFDWKETVYPRYAVPMDGDGLFDNISYFIKESAGKPWKSMLISEESGSFFPSMHLIAGVWKIVSREEAEARHARLHREWVISQLVVIDREKWPDHVPRAGVDWITSNDVTGCISVRKEHQQPKISDLRCCFKIYCLPKDLPPEPPSAVAPDRSFRALELTVMMDGALVAVCRVPIIVDGVVSVQSTLHIDSGSISKQITRTVDLTDGVEEAF